MSIVEENTDHGLTTGSTSQAIYGSFPNEVLRIEAQKIWTFIEYLLYKTSLSLLISPAFQYVMADLAPALNSLLHQQPLVS